ncbi:MAG TPA: C39 family peptidase [Anaerolineales bacterium]|nr:C39 family peptidase [Anaerolineales bacterium]
MWKKVATLLIVGLALAAALYTFPPINQRLSWRVDFALAYARGVVHDPGAVPTPLPQPKIVVTRQPTTTPELVFTPTLSPTPGPTPTATPSPTPAPRRVSLTAPAWEKQDINNCGPATLSMALRYFGWEGDQFAIADLLKPQREDRNVNVEELAYYVRTRAGWLNIVYRVGGDLETLKALMAAGLPVVVEESFYFEESYWPNDDQWAAHYNLLTGYDDETELITAQDSYYGANRKVSYDKFDEYWQSFNRLYIVIYPPEQEATVKAILGEHWDEEFNRQHALEVAQQEVIADPENAFAWFNVGTNYVYFERYHEAAQAYDRARELGLPQRMLRYQFGPFFAYFHSLRTPDLLELTEYALERTPNAEEALLWHGWALFRSGDTNAAVEQFQQALAENPNYQDAQYALDYIWNSQ